MKTPEYLPSLIRAGFNEADVYALRRCALTLHRWYELECGVEGGGIERDETTGKVTWYNSFNGRQSPFPDRETPCLKRLAKIMKRYPQFTVYHQTDPRGAPIYILRPGDVLPDHNPDSCYSRGIAVY